MLLVVEGGDFVEPCLSVTGIGGCRVVGLWLGFGDGASGAAGEVVLVVLKDIRPGFVMGVLSLDGVVASRVKP